MTPGPYDSRKYRLANRGLAVLALSFTACLALLWQEKSVAQVPALFSGLGTGLLGVLGTYGVANVGAAWAGRADSKPGGTP